MSLPTVYPLLNVTVFPNPIWDTGVDAPVIVVSQFLRVRVAPSCTSTAAKMSELSMMRVAPSWISMPKLAPLAPSTTTRFVNSRMTPLPTVIFTSDATVMFFSSSTVKLRAVMFASWRASTVNSRSPLTVIWS